jgi:dihydroorotate dehydrogenase electron transfer subunit
MADALAFTPANARHYVAPVIDSIPLSRRYFLLRVARPGGMPAPAAGQFVQVAVPGDGRFFLRRPFSVFDCTDDTMDLLIVEVGAGTRALRALGEADSIDFYGPLGHAFPRPSGKRIVAVGGGVGLAPLYLYGFRDPAPGLDTYRLLYGARNVEDLFLDRIAMEGEGVRLATDDGSHGFAGNVVALAEDELDRAGADVVFSCGPTVMMKAVDAMARRRGLVHYASLENRMGCALGACRACVVPTVLDGASPYRTVCHDGPVFDGASLVWEELPTP